tara:strand:+ start:209 stop:1579 length:1371 start_codon:yes stop_codon:yes gene_type:complete
MMRRKKELDNAFINLIRDLMVLLEETRSLGLEKSKLKEESFVAIRDFRAESDEDNHIHDELKEFSRIRKANRALELTHNANFVHCFTLFEIYVSKVVKITFKKGGNAENSPKTIYKQDFLKYEKKESDKGNDSLRGILMDEEKMLHHYGKLPKKMLLWTRMFGINKDHLYKKSIFRYDEARERRNLLVHRGVYADDAYKNSFIQIHKGSDNGKAAEEFLEETFDDYCYQTDEDKKLGRNNLRVNPDYLRAIFHNLSIMASIIYLSSFKLTKKEVDDSESIFPGNLMHEIMIFQNKVLGTFAITAILKVIDEYLQTKVKDSWKNIPKIDRFNYLICKKYILEFLYHRKNRLKKSKVFKGKTREKLIIQTQKEINSREERIIRYKNEITKTLGKNDKDLILISNHIDDDIEKVIKHITKNAKYYKERGPILEEWFMFRSDKYQKNKNFVKFKKDFKSI